jgi:SPP1 family predicted phage head-tail adaptor
MRGGKLRTLAQLQRRNSTDDDMGGSTIAYAPVSNIYIDVSTEVGRELLEAKKLNARVSHFVVTRYRSDIKPNMRLVYGSTVLNIEFAGDPTNRHRELHLICEEIVQ